MPSPIQTATIQAAVLSVTSSILAQLLRAYRDPTLPSSSTALNPLGLDFLSLLQFLAWCLIATPPNCVWQSYLEIKFPGYPATQDKLKIKIDDDGKGVVVERQLDIKNTFIKFMLDQTAGALVNNAAFLFGITLLRGGSLYEAREVTRAGLWDIMMAGYKLWPLVSILNFTIVPVERRVVVGSLVGLGWGIFMVLKTTV